MVVDSVEIRGVPDSAMRARLRKAVSSSGRSARSVFARRVECRDRRGAAPGRLPGGDGAHRRTRRFGAAAGGRVIDVTMGARVRLGEVRVDARPDRSEPRIPALACGRLTRLRPGSVLGTQELADARQSLDAVGLFDEIRITLDNIRGPPAGDGGEALRT